jgi:uncharacterized protein YjbI with pentapeptide repeats
MGLRAIYQLADQSFNGEDALKLSGGYSNNSNPPKSLPSTMKATNFWIFSLVTLLGMASPAWGQATWLRNKECVRCDLRSLNLSGMDLTGFDLSGANLSGSDLSNAVLLGANLTGANCRRTNFTNAILSKANLSGVDFEDANLNGATLYRAKAKQPFILTNAQLENTQMPGGQIWGKSPTKKP